MTTFTKCPSIAEVAAAAQTSVSSVIRDVRKGLLKKLQDASRRISFDPEAAAAYVDDRLTLRAVTARLRRLP